MDILTDKSIQIQMTIPDNKVLLNELENMVREGELFLSPSKKCLDDIDLRLVNIYGICRSLELNSIVHDSTLITLTFKPLYYDSFNLWQAYVEANIPMDYKICYDRQGFVSHIQLVKGSN